MTLSEKDIIRFKSKIILTDNCWIWSASKTTTGYGKFSIVNNGTHLNVFAHRVSFLIAYGPFNEKLFVCHKCDNPPCVNPEHLFLGTAKNNVHDMIEKNRQARGLRAVGHHKINPEIAKEIRFLRSQGWTYKELCQKFNLCKSTISYIINNKIWNF
jgi:hypothetical protein